MRPNPEEAKVLEILAKRNAVLTGDHFVYTSGLHGEAYVNKDAIYPHVGDVSELCSMLAWSFLDYGVDVVVAPAVGGVALSQWTAHHINLFHCGQKEVLAIYADKAGDDFVLRRGYDLLVPSKRVAVVEDIFTTGKSVRKVCDLVIQSGGNLVGVGLLCNRATDDMVRKVLGEVDTMALCSVPLTTYSAEECPLCAAGVAVNCRIGKGLEFVQAQGAK